MARNQPPSGNPATVRTTDRIHPGRIEGRARERLRAGEVHREEHLPWLGCANAVSHTGGEGEHLA